MTNEQKFTFIIERDFSYSPILHEAKKEIIRQKAITLISWSQASEIDASWTQKKKKSIANNDQVIPLLLDLCSLYMHNSTQQLFHRLNESHEKVIQVLTMEPHHQSSKKTYAYATI